MDSFHVVYVQDSQFYPRRINQNLNRQSLHQNQIDLYENSSQSQMEELQIQQILYQESQQNQFQTNNRVRANYQQQQHKFSVLQQRQLDFVNQQKQQLRQYERQNKKCCNCCQYFKLLCKCLCIKTCISNLSSLIRCKNNYTINSKTTSRKIQSSLVLSQIRDLIRNNLLDSQLDISYQNESIIIMGPTDVVNRSERILDDNIRIQNNNLKSESFPVYQKIWEHLTCHHQKELNDIQQQNQTTIDNKEIIIRFGNITKQKCDAVINSCDENLNFGKLDALTGVADAILTFGGQPYKNHINQLIKKQGRLYNADLYNLQNPTDIQYIISVPTIHYSQADKNLQQFKIHLEQIFKLSNQHKLKSLVIPIIGGGAAGYYFKTVSYIILTEVIVQLQNSLHVEKVVIIENQSLKIDILAGLLKDIVNPPKIRQIKYQWQWKDDSGWKDYDDMEINQQIDESYELFLNDNNLNEIHIVFPCTKLPGTHTVDLKSMTLTDIATKQSKRISLDKTQKLTQYLFDGEFVGPSLNEFIQLQKLSNIQEFQVFFKRHKVVFQGKNKVIQRNEVTNFEREVKFFNYNKQQAQTRQCPITSQFQIVEQKYNQIVSVDQIGIVLQSFSQYNLNKSKQQIEKLINNITTTVQWKVLNLIDYDFIQLEQGIKERCICYQGQLTAGQTIQICCLKSEERKLNDYLENQKQKQIYPINWITQNINMVLVELVKTDEEYKMVQKLFLTSYPEGQIYQIKRIQNKVLYEYFHDEKQKLIKFRQSMGEQLTQIELERYAWHGVKKNHPQIIYQGLRNAFDCTFCRDGMWGTGIYFAENSKYSKDYAYILKAQENQQYQGKLIFLLCLLMTGKLKNLGPQSLKQPPDGYDCVQGNTGGSDIYVLYGMDVRRAYPAYEVIFE